MSPVSRNLPSRRRRRRVNPVAISLITILAAVSVVFYAFNQGLPFVPHFTLHAVVNNSVNVRQDSPVRIAGIDVGVVQGVQPAGDASRITFTMQDSGLPVHTDATLRIRDRLFLEGGYYLELDPGSPSAPLVQSGFTIPLSRTTSPVQFYNVLSTFNAAARSSLEHLLNTLNEGFSPQPGQPQSASGAGGLKLAIPELTPVLKDVAWVTRGLRGSRPGDVETLLSGTADVTNTLSQNSPQLTALVHDLNLTSSALAASDGSLTQSVSGLDQTIQAAPRSLAAIDRALPPVTRFAQALDPSLKVAPPIVETITRSVTQLAQVVSPMFRVRLLRSLDATFAQFPSVLRLLATAFPITKGVTDCLRTHVTPILNTQVPDGSLSSGRPVWQDFVHFLPNISGASGSFDANGPYVRVLGGAGSNSLGSAGILGTLPLIGPILGTGSGGSSAGGSGQIVGSSPPGGGALLGARPAWVGDLTSAAYRPDVPCTGQPVPNLASPAAAGAHP